MKKEKFKTHGKNREMLKKLKKDLKETIEEFLTTKNEKRKEELKEKIGKLFLKLSELATIRYNWNKYNTYARYVDVDDIKGEVALGLWTIIAEKKFDLKRLKTENSIYNFLMMSANNLAKYQIRKILTKENKIRFISLERFKEIYPNGFKCTDIFTREEFS